MHILCILWIMYYCTKKETKCQSYFQVIGGERPPWAVLGVHVHRYVGPELRGYCALISMWLLYSHSWTVETCYRSLIWWHSPGQLEISLPYHSLLRASHLTAHIRPVAWHLDVLVLRRLWGSLQGADANFIGGLGLWQDPVKLQSDALLHTQVRGVGLTVDVPGFVPPLVLSHILVILIVLG